MFAGATDKYFNVRKPRVIRLYLEHSSIYDEIAMRGYGDANAHQRRPKTNYCAA